MDVAGGSIDLQGVGRYITKLPRLQPTHRPIRGSSPQNQPFSPYLWNLQRANLQELLPFAGYLGTPAPPPRRPLIGGDWWKPPLPKPPVQFTKQEPTFFPRGQKGLKKKDLPYRP